MVAANGGSEAAECNVRRGFGGTVGNPAGVVRAEEAGR